MARPVAFDREQALEGAMKLFWRQGYGATSLSQLIDEMGISKSSFYSAFSDKQGLYAEALALFGDRTKAILLALKKDNDALSIVRRFFEDTIFNVPEKRLGCGCMMVNSVLELADVDQKLSDLATAKLKVIEKEFEKIFIEAISRQDISTQQSPENLARLVMTVNQGLRVASRKNQSKKELKAIVDASMESLNILLMKKH